MDAIMRALLDDARDRALRLDSDLATAIALQDFDRIGAITVVYQDGHEPTVASLLPPA